MMGRTLIALINLYQKRGGGRRYLVECNFSPSCSNYAKGAIRRHGAYRGLGLILERLRRCNDRVQRKKYFDPVPEFLPRVAR